MLVKILDVDLPCYDLLSAKLFILHLTKHLTKHLQDTAAIENTGESFD